MEFETVIGLEVHAQVLTQSKMFCSCSSAYFNAPPNTHVCPVCLGMPGTLPVINRTAVEKTVMTGLALGCDIPLHNKFDRKNYMYPDLMKGYQISQYDLPIAIGGELHVTVDGTTTRVGITRVHLEEDTARLVHRVDAAGARSLVDVNRGGVPLMEIVSDPDMRSPQEAREYLVAMRRLLRFIGTSDGNMEEGSFRCDANVSQRTKDGSFVGPKVEIKNMNSFRAVERALEYEIERQRQAILAGEELFQETRGWVEDQGVTVGQRSKEQAHDYRYFPEPDLPTLMLDEHYVANIRAQMAELPAARRARFTSELGLADDMADVILEDVGVADYFDAAVAGNADVARDVANWLTGDVFALAREQGGFENLKLDPEALVEIIGLVRAGTINQASGKAVLAKVAAGEGTPTELVDSLGLRQESDEGLTREVITFVLSNNPAAVADYMSGKGAAVGFLIGQVMREMKGRGNPAVVRPLLTEMLEARRDS